MVAQSSTSSFRSLLVSKFTALLILTALITPLFSFLGSTNAKAERRRRVKEVPTVKHAPPQPFVIQKAENATPSYAGFSPVGYALSFLTGDKDQEQEEPSAIQPADNIQSKPEDVAAAEREEEKPAEESEETRIIVETEPAAPMTPVGTVDFDFDNDDKADIGRWHAATHDLRYRKSSNGDFITNDSYGSSGSIFAPGDFDADSKYDLVTFTAGSWSGVKSGGGGISISLGTAGDIPMVGDYDDDGTSDAAVFRPSDSTWYIKRSSDGGTPSQAWGLSGDIPVVGDFDGDGQTDFSVFRPSTGYWWILRSTAGGMSREWGLSGDVPVPGDYTGDGKTDIAVYRPSSGTWYVATSESGFATTYSQTWGNYGDQPVPADYDGDTKADLAVWRPKNGTWYISKSGSSGALQRYELGAAGDTAVPSSYLAQSAFSVPVDEVGEAKLSPRNATGGTNLYSQNFAWGSPLVTLPGRSGLDMSFGIGYNSLVWTRADTDGDDTMVFDADAGGLTPGFRFGFPVIEPVFMSDESSEFTYVMVTPSGDRVEFREIDPGTFETVDGSYARLQMMGSTDANDSADTFSIKVTATDGTQMSYAFKAGVFKCMEIKDRNGNYVTITYDANGNLSTITDTLGRVITVNYGSLLLPETITQTWKGTNGSGSPTTHTWATFTYDTQEITTDFDGLDIAGPPNGWDITVLKKITYADTSSTEFSYNGYGQVYKVENDADDDHKLNHVRTNLQSPSANQTDCPRFTETYSWVENFNVDPNDGTPTEAEQEVLVENSAPTNSTYTVYGGSEQNTSLVTVTMADHPDDLITEMHFGRTGWNEGLPIVTRDCLVSCSTESRWSWTEWTQDNTSAAFPVNPRVTETRVGDGTNTKRSEIKYDKVPDTNVAIYGRPSEVITYKPDLTNAMKRVEYDYIDSSTYLDRWMVRLPAEVRTYGWDDVENDVKYTARTTYEYDADDDFATGGLNQNISPVQHDGTNFGTTLSAGRGNLTSVTRWDATAPTTSGSALTSHVKYNKAGSVVFQETPWYSTYTRTVKYVYDEATMYNDGVTNRATYAYPTSVIDPDLNASTIKYRFDIGANVSSTSPAPAGQTHGKSTRQVFDSLGRPQRNSIYINTTEHSYQRVEYPSNGIQSKVYSTVVDTDTDGADADDEVLSESWTDGAGRVRRTRNEHPNSTGGWGGVLAEYDILGRTMRATVPTEISVDGETWTPAGDDYTRGWVWNAQEFDWLGRTTRTIPSDSTGSDGKDTLISFSGCGCAGGQIVTIEGPSVPRTDTTGNARRKKKAYYDILGRSFKTESYEWDGSTVYSSMTNQFNGRDQTLRIRHYAGSTSSSTYQDSTSTFDGFGRLSTSHKPEQRDSSNNLKYSSYTYYSDDSLATVTDARGAFASYTYNELGLKTQIEFGVPLNSTIAVTPTVSFEYDAVGNRTTMSDVSGTTSYSYDALSQMTSETKEFNSLEDSFTLSYDYEIGGLLKTLVIDPSETELVYGHDKIGRIENLQATGFKYGSFSIPSEVASDMRYRAWNEKKSIQYGSGKSALFDYQNALQVSKFEIPDLLEFEYQRNNDGRVKFAEAVHSSPMDRSYKYDHNARLIEANTGGIARGEMTNDGPYLQSFGYNQFNQITSRATEHWATTNFTHSSSFSNNRQSEYEFDDDGNVTEYEGIVNVLESSGEKVKVVHDVIDGNPSGIHSRTLSEQSFLYDGDGDVAVNEFATEYRNWNGQTIIVTHYVNEHTSYKIKSTVLGGAAVFERRIGCQYCSTVSPDNWSVDETTLYLDGKVFAKGSISNYGSSNEWNSFEWEHADPMATTLAVSYVTNSTTEVATFSQNLDPVGADVWFENHYPEPPDPGIPIRTEFAYPEAIELVEVDGVLVPLAMFPGWAASVSQVGGCPSSQRWRAFADGYEGCVPNAAIYNGNGNWSYQPEAAKNSSPDSNHIAGNGSGILSILAGDDPPDCGRGKVPVRASNGVWECMGVGEFIVTVGTISQENYEVDWSSFRNTNGRYDWVDLGRVVKRTDPAELAALSEAIRQVKSPLQNVADGINACGFVTSVGEYSTAVNGRWRDGARFYSKNFYGNQYTGTQAAALSRAGTFKMLGQVGFAGGTAISVMQIRSGEVSPIKGGVDIFMGYLGVAGGVKGAAVSTVYNVYNAIPPARRFPLAERQRSIDMTTCHGGGQ